MASGEFAAAGFYEYNADGSKKNRLDAHGKPIEGEYIFHPEWAKHYLVWPGDKSISSITENSWFSLGTGWAGAQGHLWFIGTTADGTKPIYIKDFDFNLSPAPDVLNVRKDWEFPVGCDQVGIKLITGSDNPVGWSIEAKGQPS
ncbi:MAG: hypothetical protein ACREQ5_02145 [Candidatus Dormibacteria bacterium]